MHPYQPRYLDLLARPDVRDRPALLERTLVDADVGELTVAAFLELESEGDERGVGGGSEGLRRVVGGLDGKSVGGSLLGSREVEADTVENLLDGLVGEGGTDKDGGELERDGRATDGGLLREVVSTRENGMRRKKSAPKAPQA
jgi:hypothetical protein